MILTEKRFAYSLGVLFAALGFFVYFANTALADSVTVNCSGTSGSPTAVDEASLSGDDVTFANTGGSGYCTIDAAISAASVTVDAGVVLTHPDQDTDGVTITTTGDFTLNGDINVNGRGYNGGTAGNAGSGDGGGTYANFGGNGGSHAGKGGRGETSGNGNTGAIYGSAWSQGTGTGPDTLGSGGVASNSVAGGDGGGLVILTVGGTMTLTGNITANGGDGAGSTNAAGGGSGGAVKIVTSAFSGAGTISANGGDGGDGTVRDGGGGGAGYIYLEYETTDVSTPSTTLASQISAAGGVQGTSSGSSTPGEGGNGSTLVVDKASNSDLTDATVYVYYGWNMFDGEENGTSKFQFDTVYVKGVDITPGTARFYSTSTAAYLDVDSVLTLSNVNWTFSGTTSLQIDAPTFNINTLAADDTVVIGNAGDVTWNVSTSLGVVDGLTSTSDSLDWNLSSGVDVTLSNSTVTVTDHVADSFTIDGDIDVILGTADSTNPSTVHANATWTVDTVTIYLGSSLNANGLGYEATATSNGGGDGGGVAGSFCGGGGAYGGDGGAANGSSCTGAGGSSYGTTPPTDLGSAGGSATSGNGVGGDGGGLIKLDLNDYSTQTLTLNGTLASNGEDGNGQSFRAGGGGSGGGIYVQALTVTFGGSATLTTTGGAGYNDAANSRYGGGGGGGRVAFVFGVDSADYFGSAVASTTSAGGTGPGTASDGSDGVLSSTDNGPSISTAVTVDNDSDGQIDQIIVTFTEDVDGGSIAGGDFTLSDSYAVSSASRTADSQVTIVVTESGSSDTDATPTVTIAGSIDDTSANSTSSGSKAATDGAAPVLLTITPSDGDTGVSVSEDIVATFSEAMSTGTVTYTVSPEPAGIAAAWTSGNTVLTLSHTGQFPQGQDITFEITAGDDTANNNFAEQATNPATFTIRSSGSSTPPPAPTTYGITLSLSLTGTNVLVSWQSTGNGNIGYADVYQRYSENDEWTLIADDVDFYDGERTWEITDATQPSSAFRIAGHDLSTTVATAEASIDLNTGTVTEDETTNDQTDGETTYAPSPVTGELEAVSDVSAGMYIKGNSYSTVYYIDQDMKRRPFMDAQTFFTYQDDFSAVVTVTDATLPTLTLGGPMLPKAGIVLIKVQSDPKVYALTQDDDGNTVLHWIPSEEVAAFLYSEVWADYVIDIPATFWSRFTTGNAYTGSEIVDRNSMKTRAVLNR